ncbi:reverse transcriptase domain-containing protein [Tanacetum coccineum]
MMTMWAADHVVALTPGSAITIPETANKSAIKGNHLTLVKGNQFDGRTKTDPHKQIHEFLGICNMFKYKDTENEAVRLMMFPISLTGEAKTSGKSYNPPVNSNDQQTNSKISINFDDSNEEDEEPTPQPKIQNPKLVKDTTLPKPYKPKISYPRRLRKEKMEAQYRKFLDVIRAVRINVPLIDVLVRMPNYGKFLKELISNKHKIEQISAAFLSDESSAMIQNKVPPKLEDLGSFLIPCNFNKTFSCNALADLGASINLMPYSLYAKLSLENLKPTKMSVRLADRSFQYPVGIAENMLVEDGKFTFLADFVILEMEEDSKVPFILGRPFLHTADAVIRVKQKQLKLRVGTERMIFNIDSTMKHYYLNDDTCFSIDVIDEILEEDFDALLDECSKILHSIEGTLLEEEIFAEFDEFMAMIADENFDSESDTEDPPFEKITINTDYKIKTSLEEPPTDLELKPLPDNLEYVFLEEPSFLPVIISSQLSKEKKNKLIFVLKNHKQAFAWKTTYIPEIVKLLDAGIIYPIVDSPWVSPIHYVPKKGGITVITNENDKLVPTRTIAGWRCGNPVEGPSYQGCALWRKKLKEVWFTTCQENGINQDLLNTSESSDDDTNVVNAPREPFVIKQDPGENSSQSPPQFNHNCCYECGDSLDGIFCQQCTCKSCGKGAHIGYNCPPKAPIISNPEPCNQTIDELPQTLPSFDLTCHSEKENSLPYVSKTNFVDDSPNNFNPPPQPPIYSCEFYENDARYGHYCTPQVLFIYPKPCYNQDFNFPQDFHDFQQQYLCCENCGGPHETFQCQPMNEDYYHEQNPCYDSNSFGFDQFQPPQYTVNHLIFNAQNSLLNSQNEFLNSQNKLMEQMTSMCDMVGQFIQKKEEEKRIEEEQAAKDRYWKIPVCYDDDDDEESSIPLKDIIISGLPPCVAITPVLFTKEPVDSLIMEDEHLDTILETESDELIKSSVEDLVQILSESKDSSKGECDLPPYDDSSKNHDLTFSNPLFDIDEDFTSSDESFSEEDVPNENFKIFSNPLFDLDEEITSTKVDQIDDEVRISRK